MRNNSSVLFHQNFLCFRQKTPIKVQIFRISTPRLKTFEIPYVILQASFPLNFALTLSVMTHTFSEFF